MNGWLALIAEHDPQAIPLLDRQEMAWVAAHDGAGNVRSFERVAQGGHGYVQVHVPPVLAVPIMAGVERFTLLHNHPSGDLRVSDEDRALTETILHAASVCGLTLVDHVILGPHGASVSLVERRILQAAPPAVERAAQ